jgi:uncharacterized protein
MKPPLQNGTILITGASSGIGREMAKKLVYTAKALVLVARRLDRLQELKAELLGQNPKLIVCVQACDLTDEAATDRALEVALAEVGSIDVLINNAGLGDVRLFERTTLPKLELMLRTNVLALTRLTYTLLGPMLERGRGGILNVSSTLGLTFMPGAAAYSGTKHFVTAFTEGLRLELRGTGVVVSQVCPGPIPTEFESVAGNSMNRLTPSFVQISAERCAAIALHGFARGKALIVPGWVMKLVIGLARLTPRPLLRLAYSWIGQMLRRRLKA